MKIWLFPIEPLEERYSAQWYEWFPRELRQLDCIVEVVDGERLTDTIEQGQFLDVLDTNYYKARQLSHFTVMLKMGMVKDGDVVLLLDGWNFAVDALAYMRDLGKVKFKIAACFHAGSYDPWDLLGQSEAVKTWAEHLERGWLKALDRIFVATRFHRQLLTKARAYGVDVVEVTGFPLYADEWAHHKKPWDLRSTRVVWPHRVAPEKDPDAFEKITAAYIKLYGLDGTEWVRSKDVAKTKSDYYALLGDSKVAVSTAHQETWGIAMLEAASLGCHPVVPNRLSYPDIYESVSLYANPAACARMIHDALSAPEPYAYDGMRWETAISNMLHSMKRPT